MDQGNHYKIPPTASYSFCSFCKTNICEELLSGGSEKEAEGHGEGWQRRRVKKWKRTLKEKRRVLWWFPGLLQLFSKEKKLNICGPALEPLSNFESGRRRGADAEQSSDFRRSEREKRVSGPTMALRVERVLIKMDGLRHQSSSPKRVWHARVKDVTCACFTVLRKSLRLTMWCLLSEVIRHKWRSLGPAEVLELIYLLPEVSHWQYEGSAYHTSNLINPWQQSFKKLKYDHELICSYI